MMKKERKRSVLGTYKAEFSEPTVNVQVRVLKSVADELNKLENKADFLREAIAEALKKRKTKIS